MDKIKTSVESLHTARSAMTQFDETANALTQRLSSDLEGLMPGLDESFRRDIAALVERVGALRTKVGTCVAENVAAVDERIAKIPPYNAMTYKKRNII